MHDNRSTAAVALVASIAGTLAVALALTPSLVPRPALFQGFLAGLSFGVAYVAAAWLARTAIRQLARRRPPALLGKRTLPQLAWLAWLAAGAAGVLYVALLGTVAVRWQNDVRDKVEMPPIDGLDLLTFFAVSLAMVAVVFGARRGLHKMAHLGRRWVRRATPQPTIVAAGGLLASTVAALLALTLLVTAALLGTDSIYSARNDTTPDGINEPFSTFRSAGRESSVEWEKLGMQGRAFVGGGPTAAAIASVTQRPAKEPVRVYVGAEQDESMEARAKLAVAELKRTGGFDRRMLVIATPTGSGWLERQAMDSVEYLHGGDTAIVSMQYSYQPSWVSFLFHQELPRDSSQALYRAVRLEWQALPAEHRPELFVYGLSLGASGMQSAFSGIEELTSSIDGAVFAGAPNNSQPWGTLQATRDSGTPPWQPVYDGGRNVRWLSNSGDFDKFPGTWELSRVAFLQHGTDAVTWLTPRLIWQKPDWLSGTAASGGRAPDVSDSMVWIPLVTYLQVAFDMFMGESVPASHGHNFGDVAVEAWNGVAPSGLERATVVNIKTLIAAYAHEDSMVN